MDKFDLKQSVALNTIEVFIKTTEQKSASKSITVKIIFHCGFALYSINSRYKTIRCLACLKYIVLSKWKRYYSFFTLINKFKKTQKVSIEQRSCKKRQFSVVTDEEDKRNKSEKRLIKEIRSMLPSFIDCYLTSRRSSHDKVSTKPSSYIA